MRRFLLPAGAAARPGAVLEIDGSDHHYLVRVLRLRRGAEIAVADAAGCRARATVTAVAGGRVRLLVAAEPPGAAEAAAAAAGHGAADPVQHAPRRPTPAGGESERAGTQGAAGSDQYSPHLASPADGAPERAGTQGAAGSVQHSPRRATPAVDETERAGAAEAAGPGHAAPRTLADGCGAGTPPGAQPALVLVQALPKGALMDRIVRQATEIGVARIVPVVAERTQGRADPAAQARRRQRWLRVARQAAQQSGAAPPAIDTPVPLRSYLEQAPAHGLGLLFQPGAAPPGSVAWPPGTRAAPAVAQRADSPAAVRCAVGPEGGFSAAEEALFWDRGFCAVGLPGGVLRVDTAAVAALTAARLVMCQVAQSER